MQSVCVGHTTDGVVWLAASTGAPRPLQQDVSPDLDYTPLLVCTGARFRVDMPTPVLYMCQYSVRRNVRKVAAIPGRVHLRAVFLSKETPQSSNIYRQ